MNKDKKIFITCLVFGFWSVNLGMVNLSKEGAMLFDIATGIGGMAIGVLLIIYGNMNHGDY